MRSEEAADVDLCRIGSAVGVIRAVDGEDPMGLFVDRSNRGERDFVQPWVGDGDAGSREPSHSGSNSIPHLPIESLPALRRHQLSAVEESCPGYGARFKAFGRGEV